MRQASGGLLQAHVLAGEFDLAVLHVRQVQDQNAPRFRERPGIQRGGGEAEEAALIFQAQNRSLQRLFAGRDEGFAAGGNNPQNTGFALQLNFAGGAAGGGALENLFIQLAKKGRA